MAEPTSSTAGIAIAAGTITLTGSVFGVQYDMLLAGFFGGLLSLSYLPPMPAWKIAGTVAGSSLFAGLFAPSMSAFAVHYLPWLTAIDGSTRMAAAAALGIGAQVVIPAGMQRLGKFLRGES